MKILVTQGETFGIGPEIVVKALAGLPPEPEAKITVVGSTAELCATAAALDLPAPADILPVTGRSIALAALEEAAARLSAGLADAVVTAPVNKARLKEAGFAFPGQTEFFAERLGAPDHAMMLASGGLRVVPATKHIGIAEVPESLTAEVLTRTIRVTHEALRRDFGVESPRIAVLGLNPHAGEEGYFGDEESRVIRPAVEALATEGIAVEGPLPGDAAFLPRRRSRYDAIVGAYHDQVLAPFKALAGGEGVNVTLGLPGIRTSPDHGTAEDIFGRGMADPTSLYAAIETAVTMARNRASESGDFLGDEGAGP
jgi:4-hydroxythreonine-4-phosphate dehydrogenase